MYSITPSIRSPPIGFVSGLLGGGSGSGFKAKQASLTNPVTKQQATDAYTGVQGGLEQQQQFLQALQAQNGIANQSDVYSQLQGVANGTGPNPAQAMLNNSTGQNVANQAALMASQRGASSNAGLIARQAAQQGAQTQQQAAGQGAAMQANQSMNALQGMGNLATQQVGQQQQAVGMNTNAQLQEQQTLLNSINAQNQAAVGNASQANSANANIAAGNAGAQSDIFKGIMGGVGSALTGGLLGKVTNFLTPAATPGIGGGGGPTAIASFAEGGQVPKSHIHSYFNDIPAFAHGGKVPALVSPGEKYLPPQSVQKVARGASPMSEGKTIPGQPKVGGAKNSYANDTVKADLDEGGIVIPRSVTQSKDADKKAEAFVRAVLAQKGQGLKR